MDLLQKVVLTADLGGVRTSGHIVYVHDYSLDGDEDLAVGKRVEVVDGDLTLAATVIKRDDSAGYWYLQID